MRSIRALVDTLDEVPWSVTLTGRNRDVLAPAAGPKQTNLPHTTLLHKMNLSPKLTIP